MSAASSNPAEATPILQVEALTKHFERSAGLLSSKLPPVRAVDGVTFALHDREVLGIVGESGCGKSTLGLLILRLLDPTCGRIVFEGQDITHLDRRAMRPLRQRLQIIFQDPYSSLNPRMTVRQVLSEPLVIHGLTDSAEIAERAERTLQVVGLRRGFLDRYPHELSGGQRQRIGIARALIGNPRLVVADEAVSALDVSIQAQILNLLSDLKEQFHLSLILISHDISVVQHLCDRIAVMYLGKMVEIGRADDIVMWPLHPYTEALLSAVPIPQPGKTKRKRIVLKGDIPNPAAPPPGCYFHTRCPYRRELCMSTVPELRIVGHRTVACHFSEEIFPAHAYASASIGRDIAAVASPS